MTTTAAIQDPTARRDALEAERRQLAIAARDGDKGARERVRAIGEQLAAIEDEAALGDLAEAETARLAREEAARQQAAHRAALQARQSELAATLQVQLPEAAARVASATRAAFRELRPACIEYDALIAELTGLPPIVPQTGVLEGTVVTAVQQTLGDLALGGR